MATILNQSRPTTRILRSSVFYRFSHSAAISKFSSQIEAEKNRFHIYLSSNKDPYLNLSIEHYIYEKSSPRSTILFLYINDPCVVIGRNQNPWLEANLSTLADQKIPLIRRRSGGGTVFHDHGNVNFSVIYPPADFTRDKYAELITKALRSRQPRARVNERHDIVVDQGEQLPSASWPAEDNMHKTRYEPGKPRKCSGSAYKLSRNRALHHGTCLINSSNLHLISPLLRSPLEPYVKARGVDSVRSPVTNAFTPDQENQIESFVDSVISSFQSFHKLRLPTLSLPRNEFLRTTLQELQDDAVCGLLGSDLQHVDKIKTGMQELKSQTWLWKQTPRFTFSTFPTTEDTRERPKLPQVLPSTSQIHFESRSGEILSANISLDDSVVIDDQHMSQRDIHSFNTWKDILRVQPNLKISSATTEERLNSLSSWLDSLFGKGDGR